MNKIRLQAWPAWMWKYLDISEMNARFGQAAVGQGGTQRWGEKKKEHTKRFFTEYWGDLCSCYEGRRTDLLRVCQTQCPWEMRFPCSSECMGVLSCSVVSDFGTPWTVAHPLLCPWNSPGKNTAVGSHSLLQGIFLTQGSNPGLLHCRRILYHLSYQGSPLLIWGNRNSIPNKLAQPLLGSGTGGRRTTHLDVCGVPTFGELNLCRHPSLKLTFIVQLSSIFTKSFQPHSLAQQIKEFFKSWTCRLVVIHFLFGTLASFAVQNPDLVLKAQLKRGRKVNYLAKSIRQVHLKLTQYCKSTMLLVAQSCLTLCDSMNCSPPGSSVHGIFQARILKWVLFPSPGDLPDPWNEPGSPALQVDSLPSEPPGNSNVKHKIN